MASAPTADTSRTGMVTSKDGTKIAYDWLGDGPAVILVGGAFIHRGFPKPGQLAKLMSGEFTFINYDRRGRGESGQGSSTYDVEREIEDLAAVIAAAGGSASLVGWSSGAVLVMRAVATGLPVERLVLFEPPLLVDDSRVAPPADSWRVSSDTLPTAAEVTQSSCT